MSEVLRLFLSHSFDSGTEAIAAAFERAANAERFEVITGKGPETLSPPHVVRGRIFNSDCFAAIISSKDRSAVGEQHAGSAWVSNEIGIAYALDLPMLICKEPSIEDVGLVSMATSYLVFEPDELNLFEENLRDHLRQLRKAVSNEHPSLGGFVSGLVQRALEGARPRSTEETFQTAKKLLEGIMGDEPDELLRIYTSSPILKEVLYKINAFEELEPRLSIGLQKKQALAQAFVDIHGEHVRQCFREIFIESGSTMAAVAHALEKKLPKAGEAGTKRPTVLTNNAVAYLFLWLCKRVLCEPVPEGPPDPKFAGMFGPLTGHGMRPDYKDPLENTDPDNLAVAGRLSQRIFRSQGRKGRLVLGAYSGLQVSEDFKAIYPRNATKKAGEPYTDEVVLKQLHENCRGLHVGSYENHLFKRALYMTGAPTIIFLHDEKVDCDIEVGKCHFLFVSPGLTKWREATRTHPFSFWIGCDKSSYKSVLDKLQRGLTEGDWELLVYDEGGDFPVVICHNAAFREECVALKFTPYSRTAARIAVEGPSAT